MIEIGPSAHVEPLRDPFGRRRRFRTQPLRQLQFLGIALGPRRQIALLPAQSLQALPDHSFGLFCFGLRPFFTIMFLPHLFLHLLQQFLPELLVPQIPSPLDPLELGGAQLRLPAPFHPPLKLPPPGLTVFGNSVLAQQPVHPQPGRPLPSASQITPQAAPPVGTELLLRREYFAPCRV